MCSSVYSEGHVSLPTSIWSTYVRDDKHNQIHFTDPKMRSSKGHLQSKQTGELSSVCIHLVLNNPKTTVLVPIQIFKLDNRLIYMILTYYEH